LLLILGKKEIMKMYGGIEAGGSKFVCVVSTSPTNDPVSTLKVDTTTPDETLGRVIGFFKQHDVKALGIASFGPIELRRESPTYGYITATPKPGWRYTNIAQLFQRTFGVPTGFDTDVNAAALAEVCYGAAQGLSHAIYVTVGTGIGGGAVINGEPVHGLVHPEMGHLPVPRHSRDTYAGHCIFHHDCLEGMASGPAIEDRWKKPASALPLDHEAWEFEAYYLARAICAMVYTISPQRIICGGGVMRHQQLFPLIRRQVLEMLNGYIRSETIIDQIDTFIVPPGLGDQSGTVGALELAQRAEADPRKTMM
jgi:fructokinase